MFIDPIQVGSCEIPPAKTVSQLSLTRRDRELLMEEGQSPLQVASTDLDAMPWQKEEDLRDKWNKRRRQRTVRSSVKPGEIAEDDEPSLLHSQPMQENAKLLEQEETGKLFNGRT